MCYVQHGGLYFANSPVAGMPVNAPLQAWLPAAQQVYSLLESRRISTGRDCSSSCFSAALCLLTPAQLHAGERQPAPCPCCMRRCRAPTWPAWEGAPATICTAGRCWAAMRRARSSRAHMRSLLRTRRVGATGRCLWCPWAPMPAQPTRRGPAGESAVERWGESFATTSVPALFAHQNVSSFEHGCPDAENVLTTCMQTRRLLV